MLYFLSNIPILLYARRVLGRKFVLKTVVCTAAFSLFYSVIPTPSALPVDDTLTACLLGGILSGIGAGLVLTCGGSGGSRGGGNQVYLLTNINGTTYAVKYLHMSPGSPIATGSVVSAGDQIGTVGQSGNASAPHTHIEVFKLGTMSIESYANSWNGDLAFGAGWGSGALSNTCDKRGAPCRVKPETAFGY